MWISRELRPVFGPGCAAVCRRYRRHSLVHELLQSLTFVGFDGIYVAFRIRGQVVHSVELAGISPAVAETRQDLERLALDDVDLHVLAVGKIDEPLFRVV